MIILEVLVQAEYRSQWQGLYIRVMVMYGCVIAQLFPFDDNFYWNQPDNAINQTQLVW